MKKVIPTILILLILTQSTIIASNKTSEVVQNVCISLPSNAGAITKRAAEILGQEINERSSNCKITAKGDAELILDLLIEPGIGTEGYKIVDGPNGAILIIGNDERGLLYGVGKFLHNSRFDQGGFSPCIWRGMSVPKCKMRGIYFATHFRNFYEEASDQEIKRYIESLALWGTNSIVVSFPNPWLQGFNDPQTQETIRKIKHIMCCAKAVGMRVGLLHVVNAGFASTPEELWYTPGPQCWGLVNLCPSKPDAKKLLLENWNRLLDEFVEPGIDHVVYWPYDEGGCCCKDCSPWGGHGFPMLCKEFTSILKSKFPNANVILSTWLFDWDKKMGVVFKKDGDYAGLSEYLSKDKSWVDYLMVDAHEEFPEYVLKAGAPGGLPIINFPEISMVGQYPWGGYGANPLPRRLQHLWDQVKNKLSGGFPYSEGIYEDINKVVCSQLYWDPDRQTTETLKEYIAYEFSPSVIDTLMKVIKILECNHMRKLVVDKDLNPSGKGLLFGVVLGGSRIEFCNSFKSPLSSDEYQRLKQTSEDAFRIMQCVDKQLTSFSKTNWRWRILYLRTLIDRELVRTNGWFEGTVLKNAFNDLTHIYHSENASLWIHVPQIDDSEIQRGH